MSSLSVLLLCIHACLVQYVFSQCLGAYGPATAISPAAFSAGSPFGCGAGLAGPIGLSSIGLAGPYGLGAAGLAYDGLAYPGAGFAGAYPAAGFGAGYAAYGGAGEGNVAVAGELPVAGITTVAGQVPISGIVGFGGPVAAAGTVSIIGQCSCGCGAY